MRWTNLHLFAEIGEVDVRRNTPVASRWFYYISLVVALTLLAGCNGTKPRQAASNSTPQKEKPPALEIPGTRETPKPPETAEGDKPTYVAENLNSQIWKGDLDGIAKRRVLR